MADQQVKLILTTDATGAVTGINQFSSSMKKMETDAGSFVSKIKENWLGLSASIAAVGLAASKAMEYMNVGAKAEQAEASFRTLASASGESADLIIANMKRLTNNTVDDSQLMQKAFKAMSLEFSGEQISKMAEMARQGARLSGEDVGTVFDKIVDAISTKMPKALKQYGLATAEQIATIKTEMAAGETSTDLLTIATDNYNKQIGLTGPLLENNAEKMQQYRAQIEDTKETFGKYLLVVQGWMIQDLKKDLNPMMATAASISAGNTGPIQAWVEDIIGLKQAQEELARYQAALKNATDAKNKAAPGLSAAATLALKKSELETLKALDKDYFKSQEDNLKETLALMKSVGADEYEINRLNLAKRAELNTEYYQRGLRMIELEATARGKADREKISDAVYTSEKMKVLEAENFNRTVDLARQRASLTIQTAQNDLSSMATQLESAKTYYASLQAMIEKNNEAEKKSLADLRVLRQMRVDIDASAVARLALINGTNKNMSPGQQYDTGRSALNSQFMDITNNQTGEARIKSLDTYMQKVTDLQQKFAGGVIDGKDMFGDPKVIESAAKTASDASSDINRALALQQSAAAQLTEQRVKDFESQKLWGQTISEEAAKAKAGIDSITTSMQTLSDQILNMQKTVTLTGVDEVSAVVNNIAERIQRLRDDAARPIVFTTNMSGGSSSSPNTNASLKLPSLNLDNIPGAATGTDYIPKTGAYMLHKGEAVIPAAQNTTNSKQIVINGGINLQIPAAAAPQRPEDWRAIVRNYIKPELNKLNA